jgi:hypothetical protein
MSFRCTSQLYQQQIIMLDLIYLRKRRLNQLQRILEINRENFVFRDSTMLQCMIMVEQQKQTTVKLFTACVENQSNWSDI